MTLVSFKKWKEEHKLSEEVNIPTISPIKTTIGEKIGGVEAEFVGGLVKKSSEYLDKLTKVGKNLYLAFGGANKALQEAQTLKEAHQNYQNTLIELKNKAEDEGDTQKIAHYSGLLKTSIKQPVPDFETTDISKISTPFDSAQHIGEEFAEKMDNLAIKMGTPDFLRKVSNAFGNFTAQAPLYYTGGKLLESTKIPELMGSIFANPKLFPTIGKYVSPFITNILKNIGAFGAPAIIEGEKPSQVIRDSSIFAVLPTFLKQETMFNKVITASGDSLFMGGLALLDGADIKDAGVSAVLGGIMGISGMLGERSVGTKDQALEKLKFIARKIIGENPNTPQAKRAQEILDGKLNKIVEIESKVKSEVPNETNIPVKTPLISYKEYIKTQGYEPYTSPEQLPTIQAGFTQKTPKSELPTIEFEEIPKKEKIVPRDFVYEPIKSAPQESMSRTGIEPVTYRVSIGRSTTELPGQSKYSKISRKTQLEEISKVKGISEKAGSQFKSRVFERMKAEHPELKGELGYDPIKLQKDANNAVDLIIKDRQRAYDVAMNKEVSNEVTSTSVNIAMSEKALQEKDYDLYAKLIRNRSLVQTRRGQELVAERGSLTDNSASRYVKELIGSRLDNLGKKYLSEFKFKRKTPKENANQIIKRQVESMEKRIINKKINVEDAIKLLDQLTCI